MITESFINSCFTLLLNKNAKVKRTKVLYRDVLEIIKFCESKETKLFPSVDPTFIIVSGIKLVTK